MLEKSTNPSLCSKYVEILMICKYMGPQVLVRIGSQARFGDFPNVSPRCCCPNSSWFGMNVCDSDVIAAVVAFCVAITPVTLTLYHLVRLLPVVTGRQDNFTDKILEIDKNKP